MLRSTKLRLALFLRRPHATRKSVASNGARSDASAALFGAPTPPTRPLVVSYLGFEQGKVLDKVIIQSKSAGSVPISERSVAALLNIWMAWGDFTLSGMQNGFRRLVNSVPICSPCTMPMRYAAQAVCAWIPVTPAQSPRSCSTVIVSDDPEPIAQPRSAIESSNLRILSPRFCVGYNGRSYGSQQQPDPSHAARQRASVEECLFKRTLLNLAIGDSS